MRSSFILGLTAVGMLTSQAPAWEFRSRFVERVGNIDIPIPPGPFSIPQNMPTRLRVQFGIFDDADGPAPAGGFVGWNVGNLSITDTAQPQRMGARRTPGRLAPFNFASSPSANGFPYLPGGDPFASLTDIDSTLGTQSPAWVGCDANGNPTPQPPPFARGLNTFVSIYAVTLTPLDYDVAFRLNASGNLVAAARWLEVGTPIPPNCDDPDSPEPGNVTYSYLPTAPEAFNLSIVLVSNGVPGPASCGLLALAGVMATRRRRARIDS